ncbi:hypothetical protein [Prochlorothrix hollandica]|uniref:Uncharacterized protein n=1 Tax=Prochlorothrix hollandica PCC 9006 = CALU 1027 TaxID=317619 RepID=A0A0M2PWB6_PROHO|nr:hypothetical protein [Prochlorothrix hollandica]KKJ00736.1 hypothetical protein PROH_05545 [Prochlorothrix hollandica PCC 9006 = CALU 1027]
MSYSQFKTLASVKEAFGIQTREGVRFLPQLEPLTPSSMLQSYLGYGLPIATATGSEKVRSELIISPLLIEVRQILGQRISFFSGEEFTVDESVGLAGICDFLVSRSPALIEIEAPVLMLVEAKKADLRLGLGQCAAELVAAQRFNQKQGHPIEAVYGAVSSGTLWRFMQLVGQVLTIDVADYTLMPMGQILAYLVWMAEN